MTDPLAENDAPLAEHDHMLVVEHTNQGTEETQRELAHVFTVHYIVRHPEKCSDDGDFCPITNHIDAVGIETTLGLDHWEDGMTVLRHIRDGLYGLEYWSQHYSGPEGDDWDAGVNVHVLPPEEKGASDAQPRS